MIRFRTREILAGATAIAAMAGSALAADINMTFDNIQGQNVTVNYNGDRGSTISGQATVAGRFQWSVNSGSAGNFGAGDTMYTFCTEITEYVQQGNSYNYDEMSLGNLPTPPDNELEPMGGFRAGLMSELYSNHFFEAAGLNGHSFNNQKAAAFQLAVWEVVYQDADSGNETSLSSLNDMTLDVTSADGGGFWATGIASATQNLANTWLSELVGNTGVGDGMIGLGSDGNQDQVTMVPLPAPAMLAAVGLGGVIIGRKRLQSGKKRRA
mgnify:CR=1 FL=1